MERTGFGLELREYKMAGPFKVPKRRKIDAIRYCNFTRDAITGWMKSHYISIVVNFMIDKAYLYAAKVTEDVLSSSCFTGETLRK